jgi:hypothetical protein
MRTVFRMVNLLAIAGAVWMALAILGMLLSPELMYSVSANRGGFIVLSLTELIFALPFLIFFICFHFYNRTEGGSVVRGYATILALVGSAWMSLVALLHRFPVVWHWIAIREAGLIVAVTQVIFTIPLLIFFVAFGIDQRKARYALRLRIATIASIVALSWFLLVSATRLLPVIQRWLVEIEARRLLVITEPLVAISILFFLVMFCIEPAVWGHAQTAVQSHN